jgi:uncharacterized RDD family membrane protein YckC
LIGGGNPPLGGKMFCTHCGASVPDAATFCTACGQPVAGSAPVAAGSFAPAAYRRPGSYAGFWVRFLAALIDGAVMSSLTFPLIFVLTTVARFIGISTIQQQPAYLISGGVLYVTLIMIGNWLYFAKMESSSWQATLGKKALGLQVTNLDGQRIEFGQATARYLGKFVSSLTLGIGYVMTAFTEKKQALHDLMAGTLVIHKT